MLPNRVLSLFTFCSLTALAADVCTTTDCSLACNQFDGVYRACNFDVRPYESFTSCQCQKIGGLQGNVNVLNRCVSCNKGGLAGHSLADYQVWTVICDVYLADGADVANSVGAQASTAVVQQFSSTFLPVIQSRFCAGGGGGTSLVPTTAVTTAAPTTGYTGTATGSTPSPTSRNDALKPGGGLLAWSTGNLPALVLGMLPLAVL